MIHRYADRLWTIFIFQTAVHLPLILLAAGWSNALVIHDQETLQQVKIVIKKFEKKIYRQFLRPFWIRNYIYKDIKHSVFFTNSVLTDTEDSNLGLSYTLIYATEKYNNCKDYDIFRSKCIRPFTEHIVEVKLYGIFCCCLQSIFHILIARNYLLYFSER
jgi:hypothetical protein